MSRTSARFPERAGRARGGEAAVRRPGPLRVPALVALLALLAVCGCAPSKRHRVLVLGLDGATFDLLAPWLRAGDLPNLKGLMEEGISGELASVHPILSPVAWTSAATGMNPGKHGIFDFQKPSERNPDLALLYTSDDRRAEPLWSLVSDAGHRVAVLNVPMTYPPDRVRGEMISGFPFPEGDLRYTWPPSLQDALGEYPLDRLGTSMPRGQEGVMLSELLVQQEARARIAKRMLADRKTDLWFLVFTDTDRIQHFFWAFQDPRHPYYTPELGARFGSAIHEHWKRMDRILADLLAAVPPDVTVLVISDHGFAPIYRELNMANWIRTTPLVPWIRTHAVPAVLITNGIARYKLPGSGLGSSDYEAFRDLFGETVLALRDPGTGLPVAESCWKREDLYRGRYVAKAPDIVLQEAPTYYIGTGDAGKELDPITDLHSTSYSAYHRPNGILIARGPGLRRGTIEGANLVDVAPTVLYLMGEPVPDDMDGKVLEGLFPDGALQSHPPETRKGTSGAAPEKTRKLTPEEEEKLKAIPYIK